MNSTAAIDLTSLAVDFRLLPAVPVHSAVELARKRLAQLRSDLRQYPEMEQDASSVLEFAELLRANAGTLARALILAIDAGQSSPAADWSAKLADGLRALSTTLSLSDSSVPTTDAVKDLFDRTYPEHSSLTFGVRLSRNGLRVEDVDAAEWRQHIWNALNSSLGKVDSDTAAAAWAGWRERMGGYLSGSATSFAPAILDVRSAAAQSGPGRLLKCRLQDMSLSAWSALLVEASLRRNVPAWVAVPALVALGFGPEAASAFTKAAKRMENEEERKHLEEFRHLARQRAESRRSGSMLLVQAMSQSVTYEWRPSTSVAAISLTAPSWQELFGEQSATLEVREVHFDGILAEVTGTEEQVKRQLARTRAELLSKWPESLQKLPFAWLVPRVTERYESREPCVFGATDLASAYEGLSKLRA